MSPRAVAEYTFIDRRRVDSYFEQLSSPILHDKVPLWKIAVGLKGLSLERSESTAPRPATDHEKISLLVSRLVERPGGPPARADFALETLLGRRAFIPAAAWRSDSLPGFRGLAIWFCRSAVGGRDMLGNRCLIEDFPRDDYGPMIPRSGLRLLHDLFRVLAEEFSNSVIADLTQSADLVATLEVDRTRLLAGEQPRKQLAIARRLMREAGVQVIGHLEVTDCDTDDEGALCSMTVATPDEEYTVEVIRADGDSGKRTADVAIWRDRDTADISCRFAQDPCSVLGEIGVRASPEREIDTLYRIRDRGRQLWNQSKDDIIGYPVFIAAHPSPFSVSKGREPRRGQAR